MSSDPKDPGVEPSSPLADKPVADAAPAPLHNASQAGSEASAQAAPGDSTASPPSAPAPAAPSAGQSRPAGKIRIGSQRFGSQRSGQQPGGQQPAKQQPSGQPLSAEAQPAPPPPAPAPKPVPPPQPAAPPSSVRPQAKPAPAKIPPPNTRAELPADLEVEFAQAIGGLSMDEIIADRQTTAADAELEPESKHEARVLAVQRDNVFVDLGGRRQGVLPARLLADVPEPGAMLTVVVNRFDAAEGLYELTLPGAAINVGDWSEVAEGMVVEARVTGHNTGGLECEVNQLSGFIPASQVSLYRVEDLAQFVGEKFTCVVTEANSDRRRLVLSRRAMLERERAEAKQNLLAELEVGQVRDAVVRSLQNFGAFVDLGGIDGLIHISQLSWDRIKHADEVLEVGQKVKVKIQKVDPTTGKISLAFRDLAENPWAGAAQRYPSRSKVQGVVTRITDFGAFVRLEPGIEGLVHISELSHKRIWRASDIVSEGQEVEVLVLSVDSEKQRISLSLKALEARPTAAEKPQADAEAEAEPAEAAAQPKKRKSPLKGGIGHASGGEPFGLKW